MKRQKKGSGPITVPGKVVITKKVRVLETAVKAQEREFRKGSKPKHYNRALVIIVAVLAVVLVVGSIAAIGVRYDCNTQKSALISQISAPCTKTAGLYKTLLSDAQERRSDAVKVRRLFTNADDMPQLKVCTHAIEQADAALKWLDDLKKISDQMMQTKAEAEAEKVLAFSSLGKNGGANTAGKYLSKMGSLTMESDSLQSAIEGAVRTAEADIKKVLAARKRAAAAAQPTGNEDRESSAHPSGSG